MYAGIIGSAVTVLFFVIFVAIVWWAYHKDNRQKYEDAANLPFVGDDDVPGDDRRA